MVPLFYEASGASACHFGFNIPVETNAPPERHGSLGRWSHSRTLEYRHSPRKSKQPRRAFLQGHRKRATLQKNAALPLFWRACQELVGTAAAGGTTAAATAPSRTGKGNLRFNGKTHVRQVDGHAAHSFEKIAGDAKGKSVLFKDLVFGSRLIQSQGKARAASAASGEIYADRGLFLVGEIGFQFVGSRFTDVDHDFLRNGVSWYAAGCSPDGA